jgi:ribosomal protein L27
VIELTRVESGAIGLEEAQDSYESIEVNAGDLIIQLVGGRFHRGRNLSDDPRITAALWQGEV